jgi:hypothetical protein
LKKFVKLACVVAILLSTSICYAGKEEDAAAEEAQLNSEILAPITNHFSDSDSYSRLYSLALIKLQQDKYGKIRDATRKTITDEATEMVDTELSKDCEKSKLCSQFENRKNEMKYVENMCGKYYYVANEGSMDAFTSSLSLAWGHNIVTCNFYTRMVLTAFFFNQMNNLRQGKPWLFKKAEAVRTAPKTGEHVFVLIEGKSGAMFAVDPWIRKVVRLNGVTRLSKIPYEAHEDYPYENSEELNILFAHLHKGIAYYDEKYVSQKTKWTIEVGLSDQINGFVHLQDNGPQRKGILRMRDLYMYLYPKFPSWNLGYDELFPTGTKEVEHKKSEGKN